MGGNRAFWKPGGEGGFDSHIFKMAGLFLERPLFSIVTIIVLFLTATSCLYTLSHYRPTLDAQNTTYNGNGTLSKRYAFG